ncbi:hypothetical protein [Alteriqipengyuania lutimaris]|nr:hypothetical protein [Alteriqipengyuania lutimaris]MBB3032667.1 hypothetical protein [Alteriqipengyuania lutimaris]
MQRHDDEDEALEKAPIILLGVLALVFVVYVSWGEDQPRAAYEPETQSVANEALDYDVMESGTAEYAADADNPSNTIDRVNRTLLPQEREEWASDPNSYGFNEDDRAFLEEHGVSEAEARAMETILRENGVD